MLITRSLMYDLATVITNMLSAIPWIGQDFVQFYTALLVDLSALFLVVVLYSIIVLSTVGTVNVRALRGKLARTTESKSEFLNVPYDFLCMFMGLVDGDGYIKLTKTTTGFIRMELVISLEMGDLPMLQHLHNVLKIGRIAIFPNVNTAKYIIGRVDLQEVLIPLIFYHNLFFLTDVQRAQFDLMLFIINGNITKFTDIPSIAPVYNQLPTTAAGYLLLPFFLNWFVGFIIAEGSFYTKGTGELFFSVRQRPHLLLFQAFQLLFDTNIKIDNNAGYMKLGLSSVKDLEKVVKLFSFSGLHPLLGLKLDRYNKWIASMKSARRFNNIRLP
ncbi:MAG: hypothetical protein JZD40_04805 [Sulfolobus sp.]|nr:hypothetical protein [Sulfolobus sp.]